MKTIWIIEQLDNHGEFQPMNEKHFKSRDEGMGRAEKIRVESGRRTRMMPYIRKENRT